MNPNPINEAVASRIKAVEPAMVEFDDVALRFSKKFVASSDLSKALARHLDKYNRAIARGDDVRPHVKALAETYRNLGNVFAFVSEETKKLAESAPAIAFRLDQAAN